MDKSNTARGSFIVLEGTDGAGKATQLGLLAEQLRSDGHQVEVFDFPQYDRQSSYFVSQYQTGHYGSSSDVGPYTSALFYALDRYDVANNIHQAIDDGKVVLANRYTGSSMAHQGTSFASPEERRGYFIWLDTLEFETLKIPRPDINIVLRVQAEIAQNVALKADQNAAEGGMEHLQSTVSAYDDLCQLFPKDFTRIDCVRGGKLLDAKTISKLVREKVAPLLPMLTELKLQPAQAVAIAAISTATTESTTYDASELDIESLQLYHTTLDLLTDRHRALSTQLETYLQDNHPYEGSSKELAATIVQAVIPVAKQTKALVMPENNAARSMLDVLAPSSHAAAANSNVILLRATPRNELDIVPDLLYPYSNVPYNDLLHDVGEWSYDQKTQALQLALQVSRKASVLASYGFEFVSDYGLFLDIQNLGLGSGLSWQNLTPRLGYDVPQIIEDAGLSDQYEDCFDLSLQLHSQMQTKGYENAAQRATLLGHKLRWSVSYSAHELPEVLGHLASLPHNPTALQVLQGIRQKVSETHPLLANIMAPAAA